MAQHQQHDRQTTRASGTTIRFTIVSPNCKTRSFNLNRVPIYEHLLIDNRLQICSVCILTLWFVLFVGVIIKLRYSHQFSRNTIQRIKKIYTYYREAMILTLSLIDDKIWFLDIISDIGYMLHNTLYFYILLY